MVQIHDINFMYFYLLHMSSVLLKTGRFNLIIIIIIIIIKELIIFIVIMVIVMSALSNVMMFVLNKSK